MTKKRIAFIVAIPDTASSFLKDHFIALRDYYDITLVANYPNEESKKEFLQLGVSCEHVPIVRSINLVKDIRALFSLFQLFRKQCFSCVHSVTPKAGLLTSLAGRLAGIPNRIHIFTGQVWATKKGLMRFILKLMDKVIALFDTNLLVDGSSQRNFLIEEGVLKPGNSKVLANGSISGVKMDRFVISEDTRRREREKFNFSVKDIVYIFLGRLNHDKGIGELYQAFDAMISDCPHAKLVFYGTDEEGYAQRVIDYPNIRLGENFYFPGSTPHPYEALQCADVFVLPTWREGFGSSVIEASALALPVITTDAYGVVDASVVGETGLRCKVGDADSLCACMKEYYFSEDLRKCHGKNGRNRVKLKFDYRVVSEAWLKFYQEIIGY